MGAFFGVAVVLVKRGAGLVEREEGSQCARFWEVDQRDIYVIKESDGYFASASTLGTSRDTMRMRHTADPIFIGGLDFCENDLRAEWTEDDQTEDDYARLVVASSCLKEVTHRPLYHRQPSPYRTFPSPT